MATDDYLADIPSTGVYYIEDGNAMFHSMTNIPTTFKDISLKLLDLTSNKKFMVFSTDTYHKDSIKSLELKRRSGLAEPEVLAISGENMRRPLDFKLFLQAGENKTSFCRLLLKV